MKPTQLNAENFKYSPFQLIFVVYLVFNEWPRLKFQGQFRQRFQDSMISFEERHEEQDLQTKMLCDPL